MLDKLRKDIKSALLDSKNYKIETQLLDTIVLDMSRVSDKMITNIINQYKNQKNIIITTPEKELLRRAILGYDVDTSNYNDFDKFNKSFNKESYLLDGYKLITSGLEKRYEAVLGSLYSRTNINKDIEHKYQNYIENIEEKHTQLLYFKLSSNDEISKVFDSIRELYNSLENYHYCMLDFDEKCDWSLIYKIALYMENFKLETNLRAFKSEKHKNTMIDFIDSSYKITDNTEIIENIDQFYNGVNYGFQFQDFILTEDGTKKLLVFQKVELDENPVPCPSCFETTLRGNSYPKMLYKSFECQNPTCPSRSKSGRGKRFDYYSIKRNNKLITGHKNNYISNTLRNQFRRDIVKNNSDFLEFAINFYTWSENLVTIISNEKNYSLKLFGRRVRHVNLNDYKLSSEEFYNLTFYKLMKSVLDNAKPFNDWKENMNTVQINKATIIKGNSTHILYQDSFSELHNLGITSPPYFNAREYSQWPNLILYLFDMLFNAEGMYQTLKYNGIYAYNIGDIVDRDNIYINSQMSITRQMLGFYSMMIFEIVGFQIIGNDIWDKGEVQSKRNSSSNSFPGFLRPINCYEHIIYVQKSKSKEDILIPCKVSKIETVKKINSKGENKYGHTAPYPEELVRFIIKRLSPYLKENARIIDPFLGSGTTSIVANRLGYKSTGIELDENYFNLSCDRLENNYENLIFDF